MTTIITRQVGPTSKGSALTNAEVDQNFINLNEDKAEKSIIDSIEKSITGRVIINTWDLNSHVLIQSTEARCAILDLQPGSSGTAISGAGEVICPATSKVYVVSNNTGYLITFKTASGTGVDIQDGNSILLVCDGTNVIEGITQSAGGGVPVGASVSMWSANSSTGNSAIKTVDGISYQRGGSNVAYDAAVHDLTALKANAPESLCYGSYQVTGTNTNFFGITYSASLDLYVAVGSSAVGLYNSIYTSTDAATWTARTAPVTTQLNYVFFANSLFVALGASGTILTSPDGITWTQRTSNTSLNLTGGTYSAADGKFVVLGGSAAATGVVLTSPDGITWTKVMDTQDLKGIAYSSADDVYVVVGNAGAIYTSPDGASWTYRTSGVTTALNAVAYSAADDIFVAVGASGVILTSAEGTTWTARTSDTTNSLNGVCYSAADDLFVVVGASGTILTSANGTSWTSRTSNTAAQLNAVAYSAADDVYIAVGNGGVAVKSSDGITWTLTLNNQQVNSIAYSSADAIYVAVGAGGAIWTSADTVSWTYQQSGVTTALQAVAYSSADDIFVAVGASGVVRTSPDGITWTARSSGTTNTFYGVAYSAADDIFVAVGASGTIITSSDGVTWTIRTSGSAAQLNAVVYDSVDDVFVAVGASGTILKSSDGVTWDVVIASSNFTRIAYSATLDLYVAVGGSGALYTSPDQSAWTKRNSNIVGQTLNNVCWYSGLGLFISVGNNGTITTSPDGVTWTSRTSGTTIALTGVAAGNGLVVAAGNNGTTNVLLTSPDGVTWTSRTTSAGAFSLYNRVAFHASSNTFSIFCTYGFIISSTDGITWTTRQGGAIAAYSTVGYKASTTTTVNPCSYGGVTVTNNEYKSTNWVQVQAYSASNYLYSAAYSTALNLFCVVGTGGEIYTSPDGLTWTSRTSGTTSVLNTVMWDAALSLFIVTGNNIILTSADGVTWTSRLAAGGNLVLGYKSPTATYYAISTTTTYTSTDGVTWTSLGASNAPGITSGSAIVYFAANNRLFYSGAGNDSVYSSADGTSWLQFYRVMSVNGTTITGISASGSAIIVTGLNWPSNTVYAYSLDGATWNTLPYGPNSTSITPSTWFNSGTNKFYISAYGSVSTLSSGATDLTQIRCGGYAVGATYDSGTATTVAALYGRGPTAAGIIKSTDGVTWIETASAIVNIAPVDVDYNSGVGTYAMFTTNAAYTSTDLVNWTSRSTGANGLAAGIGNATDGFFAVGTSGIASKSSNGVTWTPGYIGTTNALNGVTYGSADDRIVAVGASGNILTSPDGIAWTYVTPPTTNTFYAVTYDSTNDLFVAVGAGGTIYTSPDAATWTVRTSNTTAVLYCAYFNTTVKNIVGGAGGLLDKSTNGTDWTAAVVSTAQNLLGVTYGSADDKIVVVGAAGTILTSPDGSAWTARSSNISTSINAVCYDSTTDLFCAVAFVAQAGAPAYILTSPDGVTWTQRSGTLPSSSTAGLVAITSTSTDGFVAVGNLGCIAKSTDGTNWSVTLNISAISRIAYSSSLDKFVMVGGTSSTAYGGGGYIMTSSDALAWTVTKADYTTASVGAGVYVYAYQVVDVHFDSSTGMFIAVGGNLNNAFYNMEAYLYTSTDGVSWTKRTLPLNPGSLGFVTSGNGVIAVASIIFVGQGVGLKIMTSTDGVTWNSSMGVPLGTGNMSGITYGSDIQKFVLCGNLGQIYVSNTTNSGSPTSVYVSAAGTGTYGANLGYMRTK